MSNEKDEDLETLTETCENEVEPEPKAKQYKKAGENDKRRKGKKERTPAQIAAFEKCRAKREENRLLRKQEREKEAQLKKKKTEEKIVKKAVNIKKREKLEQAIIESSESEDSDSEPDIQAVKKYVAKKKQKRRQPKRAPPSPPPSPEPEIVESGPYYFFA